MYLSLPSGAGFFFTGGSYESGCSERHNDAIGIPISDYNCPTREAAPEGCFDIEDKPGAHLQQGLACQPQAEGEEMKVYRIWDSKQGVYWKSPRGTTVWNMVGHAKTSWNFSCSWGDNGRFDDNDHLQIHEFALVRSDT